MPGRKLTKNDRPNNISNSPKHLGDNDFIVSKTDTKGVLTYCNQIFVALAGYSAQDLIGSNHNVIRHPDMPKLAFKVAWNLIKAKKEFFGFVKNLSCDGGYYWVFATITADLDSRGNIVGYTSIRRKPPQSAINTIEPIYKQLIDAERHGGVDASAKVLNELLAEKMISYDEFIINLQKDMKV
ncbi:MAG: PAS domain-containing protein [Campylobacterota bacterium]|nr:PAS domain-containing protein [Campylobacterota bacterium]